MMEGDGTSLCHKGRVMHTKLGVLAPIGMTVLPELGRRGARSVRLRKAGTPEASV